MWTQTPGLGILTLPVFFVLYKMPQEKCRFTDGLARVLLQSTQQFHFLARIHTKKRTARLARRLYLWPNLMMLMTTSLSSLRIYCLSSSLRMILRQTASPSGELLQSNLTTLSFTTWYRCTYSCIHFVVSFSPETCCVLCRGICRSNRNCLGIKRSCP